MRKPHKFFERHLNNNLPILTEELSKRYDLIESLKVKGVTAQDKNDYWLESGSLSTVKWREYNVFQFHIDGIYNLYKAVSEMAKEACEYYELDFDKQKFMMQGWFNINKKETGKLNWHEHGEPGAPNFHGYYCVNAEPSVTHYQIFGDPNNVVQNVNINNRAIFSEMGHPHAQGDWDWDGKRITVAYDVVPLRSLPPDPAIEQHWIPLN